MIQIDSDSSIGEAPYPMGISFEDVKRAAERVTPHIIPTPLLKSDFLQQRLGHKAPVFLKAEIFQHTGSFKVRGAANKILALREQNKKPSRVVASSLGNHAQAVAYMARRFEIPATIVMPETAPLVKVESTRALGAEVVLHGTVLDEAYSKAQELTEAEEGAIFIHPYADPDVVAGQGVLGLEIADALKQYGIEDNFQTLIPLGGGGLFCGVATALKSGRSNVDCYGVVSAASPAMAMSFSEKKIVPFRGRTQSLADGLSVKTVHPKNFEMLMNLATDVQSIEDDEISQAIALMMEKSKIVLEGAGAAAVGAFLEELFPLDKNKPVVLVLCGGNINMQLAANIVERGLTRLGRWQYLAITIEDKPGELGRISSIIGGLRANVRDVHHDRLDGASRVGQALLKIKIECRNRAHAEEIKSALEEAQYPVRVLKGS